MYCKINLIKNKKRVPIHCMKTLLWRSPSSRGYIPCSGICWMSSVAWFYNARLFYVVRQQYLAQESVLQDAAPGSGPYRWMWCYSVLDLADRHRSVWCHEISVGRSLWPSAERLLLPPISENTFLKWQKFMD